MRAWFATDLEKRKSVVQFSPPSTLFFESYSSYMPLKDVTGASEIRELSFHPWLIESGISDRSHYKSEGLEKLIMQLISLLSRPWRRR